MNVHDKVQIVNRQMHVVVRVLYCEIGVEVVTTIYGREIKKQTCLTIFGTILINH